VDPGIIKAGAALLVRLPRFVNRRFTIDEARAIQAQRLRHREARFLEFMRRAVYATPGHPVRQLLDHAGCAYGDLEALVNGDGLEAALGTLLRRGVYVTVDEFKGRRPAVRGSTSIAIDPERMRNPLAAFHIRTRSGGSRSAGTPVPIDLAFVRACAVAYALHLDARGAGDWRTALWTPPAAGARFRVLKYCCFGPGLAAWFSQVDPADPGLDRVFRLSERALRWGVRLGGVRLPHPVWAPLEDPRPLLQWIRGVLDQGRTPYVRSFASSIVRLATAALEAGIDLRGTKSTMAGEPITQTRLDIVAAAGIEACPRYGSIECGPVGYACLDPEVPDETHVVRDLQAVIQAEEEGARIGMPARALLTTGLHHAAPFVMLNVSMGDAGDLAGRACGCPMESLGWTPHLTSVRSYEKLTAGGMTFYDSDLIGVLERALPEQFGGNAADYQLVEEEDATGRPFLTLLVHPRLGPLDDARIADAFLRAIGKTPGEGLMAAVWREAGVVRVARQAPRTTASSKVLHLHVNRPRR
jgi:hypothetical protein